MQLDFPEIKIIKANESTFAKILKSRKTAPYETALAIARLIILNYAPSLSSGSERMLALLFDMNSLWEEYVLIRLKQVSKDLTILGQDSKVLWNGITIRPDIVIKKDNEKFIIDTKWKNIDHSKPSTHDLRQMYVYNDYWESTKAMLLYPSSKSDFKGFKKFEGDDSKHTCGLAKISIFKTDGKNLNDKIGEEIINWFIKQKS